jgi:hypothetical protein
MKFNLSGVAAETHILEKREVAYHQFLQRICGGSPALEQTPGLIERFADRGEAAFDYEFVGFRPFRIESIRS